MRTTLESGNGRASVQAGFVDAEPVCTVGEGPIDNVSREVGPGFGILVNERDVCGLVRWDADEGIAYDAGEVFQ